MCLPKIARTRALVDEGRRRHLAADRRWRLGGDDRALRGGRGGRFVAGSSVFGADHPDEMVTELRRLASEAA
jgi:hypothetical protein